MKNFCTGMIFVLLVAAISGNAGQRMVDTTAATTTGKTWPNQAPAVCTFPKPDAFAGLGFTGRHVEYTGTDTWYSSWTSDNRMYSP